LTCTGLSWQYMCVSRKQRSRSGREVIEIMAKAKVGVDTITGEYRLEDVAIDIAANGYIVKAAYTRIGGKRAGFKRKQFIANDTGEVLTRVEKLLFGITD